MCILKTETVKNVALWASTSDHRFSNSVPENGRKANWGETPPKRFTGVSRDGAADSMSVLSVLRSTRVCVWGIRGELQWAEEAPLTPSARLDDGVYNSVKVMKLIRLPHSAHSMQSGKEQQKRTASFRRLSPLPRTTSRREEDRRRDDKTYANIFHPMQGSYTFWPMDLQDLKPNFHD